MENKEVRNQSLDLIKIIAMFGVIALHTTHRYMSPGSFGIADVFYETAVISIPLFFMTSGYLLIPRKNISMFYVGRKIWGIIRFVCIMVFLFWLWNTHKRGIHFSSLFRNLWGSFFQEGEQYIFWYFGTMIILYALLPIMCKLYEKYLSSYILLLLIIMLCANMISSTNLTHYFTSGGVELYIIQTFRIWNWMFYFMLGGLANKIHIKIPWALCIVMLVINVVNQEMYNPHLGTEYCEYYYSALPTMFLVSLIFLFIVNLKITGNPLIKELSKLFLPVFSLHLFILERTPHHLYDNLEVAPIINWISVSAITVTISYILMKVPYINRIFRI